VGVGDLSLLRETPTMRAPGMHHVGLEEWSEANLDHGLELLPKKGVEIERHIDHPARRALTIRDPSGNRLQFFVNRDWRAETIATVSAEDAPYLL
jgi:catechol 2,3-dioxygenase